MSVINRLEVSNCINLDNYKPKHKEWVPHYPYLEINFGGQSAAVKSGNGTGKTTINDAYYTLVTRDRSMTKRFKARMAPKRKGVWSHFRLEMLYKTPEDNPGPQFLGKKAAGEAWVFGMYGYSDDEMRFYCFRGYFEDCPIVIKDGHKHSLINNEDFSAKLKPLSDASSTWTIADWKKAVSRHIDESLTKKMLAYHRTGGGDGTDNFFKVDRLNGEDYDTGFFYSHIAPETLVECMGSYGDDDEHGFEDTLLKSAKAILDAKYSVDQAAKDIEKLSRTYGILSSAKDHADQHRYAQECLAKEARETLAEYHFLRDCTTGSPLPLLPVPMEHNSSYTQFAANAMVLQDGEWLLPDYVLAIITRSTTGDVNRKAERNRLVQKNLKRSQLIEIPCHLDFERRGTGGHSGYAYRHLEALFICRESERFAEGWSQDVASRAISYAWAWRTGSGEHNIFRKLRQEGEKNVEALGGELLKDEASREEKTGSLQRLNSEIQAMNQAVAALSEMRQSGFFMQHELANPSATGEAVEQARQDARQEIANLQERHVALEDGRQAHARVASEFEPKSPKEACDALTGDLVSARQQSFQTKRDQDEARESVRLARQQELEAQVEFDGVREQKGEIDLLAPHMRKFESLFPKDDPRILAETVPQELEQAKIRRRELTIQIKTAIELAKKFSDLSPGVTQYRSVFEDEAPQGLAAKVTRALSDAEHNAEKLEEEIAQVTKNLLSLTHDKANWRNAQERFGKDSNFASLERDLEEKEKEATEVLSLLSERIRNLSPLVEALIGFERHYPTASPAIVERQREARRRVIAVNISDLQSGRGMYRKQISDLHSVGTAAGRIASEVLDCVGGSPLLIYQAIGAMELSPERRKAVMAHFSHVLHSPVYRNPSEAKLALESLAKAGIEAPIFSSSGLEEFCRNGELSWAEGQIQGLLAGIETMQVKAILDPSFIPALIQHLEQAIEDIENKLSPLEDEQGELSPDSARSTLISQARKAAEEEARIALDTARSQHDQMTTRLTEIRSDRSEEVIQNIRFAARYIEAGGEEALQALDTRADQLKHQAISLSRQMPELARRACEQSLGAIQSMLEYAKLGGLEQEACNADAVQAYEHELAEIEESLPVLQSRFNHLSVIVKAHEFVQLGGWEKAKTLDGQIAQARKRHFTAKGDVATADDQARLADELVDAATTRLIEASNAQSRWANDIQRAIRFLDDDGASFDATYREKHRAALEAEEQADKRSRFNFPQAQQAADSENDLFFHENKVKQRDELNTEIGDLSARIAERRKDQDVARQEVDIHRIAADKADAAAKLILDQWKEVRGIMQDLPSDQRAVVGADNLFVNDSQRAVSQMRDAFDGGRWSEALEELEGLAENTLQFPLSQRRSSIKEHGKERQKALKSLKNEVMKVLDTPSNNLSEGEIEALANPTTEAELAQSVLNLHRIIEEHLLKAEQKHELNKKDVEDNKQRMLSSMAGFTDSLQDNFDLLKRVMSTRGGGASIKISGTVIGTEGLRDKLDNLVDEIDTQLNRRRVDLEASRVLLESEQAFHDRLRNKIRSEFYRAAFRAPESSNASGPRVFFSHPQIGGGREIPLSKEVSTGQFNALTLLILVKLADFSMRRDARNEHEGLTISRTKRLSTARTVMIDGLFSNLSDRKMIRESLSVLRSLKGSFQLIGWIHHQQYENDYDLFPACVTLRRTGVKQGYVLAEDVEAPPLPETQEVAAMEIHISPVKSEETDDA